MRRLIVPALLTICLATAAAPAADDFKLESGFTLLIDKDLTGWKLLQKKESLDGKNDAANMRFVVKEGVLIIDPKVKGDLRIETAKEFGDATIKFDFKPGEGCNNDLFFRGAKFDIKKEDVKNWKLGEWNTFEIIATGDMAEYKCNGESIKKLKMKDAKSPFGIRAEFGPIEIRRLRIKAGS